MATGNYNHITAQQYEDIGLFTVDDAIGADATDLFNFLTGYSKKENYRKLLVAPVQLREKFSELITNEMAQQEHHGDGRIILKMNALVDDEMIRLLYKASQAGVKIDLIVRSICCLRPGVPGLSENIRVISVLGRFLEHSRIFYFYNHGKETIFMGSADLMPRNLNQRVEVLFPVEDRDMIRHIRDDVLDIYLKKNIKAWQMQPDGQYERIEKPAKGKLIDVQNWFLKQR
jgi:polyphosphate kinase